MIKIAGGVTAAMGFQASGIKAFIKNDKKDMAMVYSDIPAVFAGTFTTNLVKAAPVLWCQKLLENKSMVKAVVLNSGIANACTGEEGVTNNRRMAEAAAKALKVEASNVLTASTGVIGKQLPIEKIEAGAGHLKDALQPSHESGTLAAEAIMTTDTYSKECAVSFEFDGAAITVGGMAKGSGMIHPNMATMLSVITTDFNISRELLMEALSEDVKNSFNMVSVDRDTSTNDTLLLLANGCAGNGKVSEKGDGYKKFCKALNYVTTSLAKLMAGDGEGATKLFEAKVVGAKDKPQAVTLSKAIITSNLVKTAVYGNDANWGRILCAMGYAGVEFRPEAVDLYIESVEGKLKLVENGMAADYREDIATKILSAKEVCAIADIKMGDCEATAWGCDLTYDYIKINADYRS